jgi:hypothetical protein
LLSGSGLFGRLDEDVSFVREMTEILAEIDRYGTRNVLAAAVDHSPEAMSA